MNAEPLVCIRALNIQSDEKTILYDVDLDLLSGEVTGLMGPMGCGKSTLLKFLVQDLEENGLQAEYSVARYNGSDLVGAAQLPAIVSQHIREQIDSADASAIMLFHRQNQIAHCTRQNPKLICIDEPTAGLSESDGKKMMAFLRGVAKRSAVLVVSHNLDEVKQNCDRVILMASGRIVSTSKTAVFFSGGDGDSDVEHFIQSGSLDLPHSDTPAADLSPEYRPTPQGFNLETGGDSSGATISVVDGKLSLKDYPVDANGILELTRFSKLATGQHLYHFETQALSIYDSGRNLVERIDWDGKNNQPDHNKTLTLKIGKRISDFLDAGGAVVINSGFNQNACAAVLAAFYVLKDFSAQDALRATRKKLPNLHLGMRLEQLIWDVELEISMTRKTDSGS